MERFKRVNNDTKQNKKRKETNISHLNYEQQML